VRVKLRHLVHPVSATRSAIRRWAVLRAEDSFRQKHFSGQVVDLAEWAIVHPDSYFASYRSNLEHETRFARLSQELKVGGKIHQSVREMWNIYNWVTKTGTIPGDLAEVGVYRGGTAKLICEVKGNKPLHLFDTFKGLPKVDPSIDRHQEGDITGDTADQVRSYLSAYSELEFYEGVFPESAARLVATDTFFSFVHLDVDIYRATLACLEFFYPRMSRGAALISHDYRSVVCPGVRKAFDEFFAGKPESVVELWDSQALVIKL
jgi:O-methyltransferase